MHTSAYCACSDTSSASSNSMEKTIPDHLLAYAGSHDDKTDDLLFEEGIKVGSDKGDVNWAIADGNTGRITRARLQKSSSKRQRTWLRERPLPASSLTAFRPSTPSFRFDDEAWQKLVSGNSLEAQCQAQIRRMCPDLGRVRAISEKL